MPPALATHEREEDVVLRNVGGKHYPERFKIEAVKQVLDRSHFVADVVSLLYITRGDSTLIE